MFKSSISQIAFAFFATDRRREYNKFISRFKTEIHQVVLSQFCSISNQLTLGDNIEITKNSKKFVKSVILSPSNKAIMPVEVESYR